VAIAILLIPQHIGKYDAQPIFPSKVRCILANRCLQRKEIGTTQITKENLNKGETDHIVASLTSTGGGIEGLLLPLSLKIAGTNISLGDNAGAYWC